MCDVMRVRYGVNLAAIIINNIYVLFAYYLNYPIFPVFVDAFEKLST